MGAAVHRPDWPLRHFGRPEPPTPTSWTEYCTEAESSYRRASSRTCSAGRSTSSTRPLEPVSWPPRSRRPTAFPRSPCSGWPRTTTTGTRWDGSTSWTPTGNPGRSRSSRPRGVRTVRWGSRGCPTASQTASMSSANIFPHQTLVRITWTFFEERTSPPGPWGRRSPSSCPVSWPTGASCSSTRGRKRFAPRPRRCTRGWCRSGRGWPRRWRRGKPRWRRRATRRSSTAEPAAFRCSWTRARDA